jgi:hypothetical protein
VKQERSSRLSWKVLLQFAIFFLVLFAILHIVGITSKYDRWNTWHPSVWTSAILASVGALYACMRIKFQKRD